MAATYLAKLIQKGTANINSLESALQEARECRSTLGGVAAAQRLSALLLGDWAARRTVLADSSQYCPPYRPTPSCDGASNPRFGFMKHNPPPGSRLCRWRRGRAILLQKALPRERIPHRPLLLLLLLLLLLQHQS